MHNLGPAIYVSNDWRMYEEIIVKDSDTRWRYGFDSRPGKWYLFGPTIHFIFEKH